MKTKIAIVTNTIDIWPEDELLKDFLTKSGYSVDFIWVDESEESIIKYDLIIRRNTWTEDDRLTDYYRSYKDTFIKIVNDNNIKSINLYGVDDIGKGIYLVDFFENYSNTIPTITNINNLSNLPISESYIIKESKSLGSEIGQYISKKDDIESVILNKYSNLEYIIQPLIKFKKEIQLYFVNGKYMYSYSYTPSKHLNFGEPIFEIPDNTLINTANNYLKKINKYQVGINKTGFARVDFLLSESDNKYYLLEIEDSSANMNLSLLKKEMLDIVFNEYLNLIQSVLKERED